EVVAAAARVARVPLRRARCSWRLARAAGGDAGLVAVAAAHGIAAGVVPRERRALGGGTRAASAPARRSDAAALMLTPALDAEVRRAGVAVIARGVARAPPCGSVVDVVTGVQVPPVHASQ